VFGTIYHELFAVPGWRMKVKIYDCCGVVGRSVMARVVVAVELLDKV
jgi:hypothetical protein